MTIGLAVEVTTFCFAVFAVLCVIVFEFVVLIDNHPVIGYAAFFVFMYAVGVALIYFVGGAS